MIHVELLPLNGGNCRHLLPKKLWDQIRQDVYEYAGWKCEICEERKAPLHCHEQFYLDKTRRLQKLSYLIALCPWCHACCHLNFHSMSSFGVLAADVVEHYCEINGCDREEFWDIRLWAQRELQRLQNLGVWTATVDHWQEILDERRYCFLAEGRRLSSRMARRHLNEHFGLPAA